MIDIDNHVLLSECDALHHASKQRATTLSKNLPKD
jgi:hypothetical protein